MKINWTSNTPDWNAVLCRIPEMRTHLESNRENFGEEYYAQITQYLTKMEENIHRSIARNEKRDRIFKEITTVSSPDAEPNFSEQSHEDHPSFRAASRQLRRAGYLNWQVDKLIQYAGFIQSRGWSAFDQEDAQFLKEKYLAAGLDPMTIDFSR